MKIKAYLLTALLSLTILLSVVLSIILWDNPAYYEKNKSTHTNESKVIMNSRSLSYVYAPFQIVQTDNNGGQNMLTNRSINLVDGILNKMNDYHYVKFENYKQDSKKNYFDILNHKNSVMLNYSSSINTKIFSKIIDNKKIHKQVNKFPNHLINRIVIPTDTSDEIYLLSDHHFKIYRLKVNHHSLKNLLQGLSRNSVKRIPIQMADYNGAPFIKFKNDISMPQYGYIINNQNISYYASYLNFPSNSKNYRHRTVYNSNSRQLESNDRNSAVIYSAAQDDMITDDRSQFLKNTYRNVMKLGINLENVHFYNYDPDQKTVYYRYFVEGFPILGNNPWSMIKVEAQYNNDVKYYFSLNSLEVPVPTGRNNIVLPSTTKALNNLRAAGYNPSKVSDIEIGYHTNPNYKNKSGILINLIPSLYVKYNGSWMTYNHMLYHN